MTSHAPSGITATPSLPWGSHFAQVFKTGAELSDLLVPYFKAGLENNERCLWVTGAPFNADRARSNVRAAVSNLDRRERNIHIEIADANSWYSAGANLEPSNIVSDLLRRE